jgi:hypothetical protein
VHGVTAASIYGRHSADVAVQLNIHPIYECVNVVQHTMQDYSAMDADVVYY